MESIQGLFNEDLKRVAIVIWGHVIGVMVFFFPQGTWSILYYSLVDHDVIDMPQHMCFERMYTCVSLSLRVLVRVVCALAAVCTVLEAFSKAQPLAV